MVSTTLGSYLYMIIMIIPHTIVSMITHSGNLPHIDARYWARWTLFCANVHVKVQGEENIPNGPAIYMSNHSSHFDVFSILGYLNIQFRWTVKKELYRIPILGLAMRRAGYIMIDRSDHEKAMESMKRASENIRSGTSVVIFPEGTRSSDGNINYPFKKGGFHMAMDAGVPIVPISISGSTGIMPKHSKKIYPGTITMVISRPVETQGRDLISVMEEVYKSIDLSYNP